MTVSNTTRRAGPYIGNNSNTSFAFAYKIFDTSDVLVVFTDASGVDHTLVMDSDYSVAMNPDQDNSPGGTVTYPLSGSLLQSTQKLTLGSDVPLAQDADISNAGAFYPDVIETALDNCVVQIQQLQEEIDRSVKVPISSTVNPDDLITALQQAAVDAENAANAAAVSEGNAATSATAAASSQTAAAASAATAQTLVDSIGFRDVVFKTFADSPIAVDETFSGKLISIDTSGGNVVINLAAISALTLPFTVGVKKTTTDLNTLKVNAGGSDKFDDGSAQLTFASVSGASLIPDTDTTPDEWSVASFGVTTGQQIKQQFVGGVDFTPGTTTSLTITKTPLPAGKDSLSAFFDGAYQQDSTYSYNAATGVLTFNSAIGGGVTDVEVVWVSPLPIGTPADGTVTNAKLAAAAVKAVNLDPDSVHGQTAKTTPALADEFTIWDSAVSLLKKMTLTNLFKLINLFTQDASPDPTADYVVTYDTSANGPKKVLLKDLVAQGLATIVTLSTSGPTSIAIPTVSLGRRVRVGFVGVQAASQFQAWATFNGGTTDTYGWQLYDNNNGGATTPNGQAVAAIGLSQQANLVDTSVLPFSGEIVLLDPSNTTTAKSLSWGNVVYKIASQGISWARGAGYATGTAAVATLQFFLRAGLGNAPNGAAVNPTAGYYYVIVE